jgi:hypothetical protein
VCPAVDVAAHPDKLHHRGRSSSSDVWRCVWQCRRLLNVEQQLPPKACREGAEKKSYSYKRRIIACRRGAAQKHTRNHVWQCGRLLNGQQQLPPEACRGGCRVTAQNYSQLFISTSCIAAACMSGGGWEHSHKTVTADSHHTQRLHRTACAGRSLHTLNSSCHQKPA